MTAAYGGSPLAGFPVGVLTIKTLHPILPGNVQHAQSFLVPVIYEEVQISDVHALMRGEADLLDPIVVSAKRLALHGVRAIAGACGSFAYYQTAVANTLNIPVFLSIMTQVPFIQQSLAANQKLCIVCAAAASINSRIFEQCRIVDTSNLVIREMKGHPEFDRLLNGSLSCNVHQLRNEVVSLCEEVSESNAAVAAFLLQCSELPPFGADIQRATGLPVFDMTLLIRWLQSATYYLPYSGMVREHDTRGIAG